MAFINQPSTRCNTKERKSAGNISETKQKVNLCKFNQNHLFRLSDYHVQHIAHKEWYTAVKMKIFDWPHDNNRTVIDLLSKKFVEKLLTWNA